MITSKDIAKIDRLYSDESKFTHGAFARGVGGGALSSPNHPGAVAWCIWGACNKAGVDMHEFKGVMIEAGVIPPGQALVHWNDCHVFKDIKSGLTKATLFLKRREGAQS